MTPTPRTDAAETMWNDIGMMVVLSTFARQLERELADWKVLQASTQAMLEQAERDLDAERALADRLAETMRQIADGCNDAWCRDDATVALASWKEARHE